MLILTSVLCVILHSTIAFHNDCNFPINRNDESHSPLILEAGKNFIVYPQANGIPAKTGKELRFSCPAYDSGNYLEINSRKISQYDTFKCIQGTRIESNGKNSNYDDLICHNAIRGDVYYLQKRCGPSDKGLLYEIGFDVGPPPAVTLFFACHDKANVNTLYTKHEVLGKNLLYATKNNNRPSDFKSIGIKEDLRANIDLYYTKIKQLETFTKLLGSESIARRYIDTSSSSKSYLARGHLAPDGDFVTAPLKQSTYFFVNACPQWQSINTGNWKRIEYTVRDFAIKSKKNLEVYTGTHGVLTLENSEIYLGPDKKIPVPKYIWKIVYDKVSKKAIVLVTLNNPFFKGDSDYLCDDICGKFNWQCPSWNIKKKGQVHCCEYSEFISKVHTAPSITVRGVLRNSYEQDCS